MSNDKYRKAIFNAQVFADTGAGTYEKAVDMACRDMLRAGLNCVEYKNGARHTLSDYAEMALRTADKRAYLYGEGQKRQEWGIAAVIVNNRRGGCPHCAPYVGRVFIDDVYSGGNKSDGKYPLLSEAIRGGLFHPRCKDSTSTYFEGITEAKPVTKEELAEMDRREKLEQKQSYCKNEAKKNRRIAEHSLDPDNQKSYTHRADVFEQKAKNAEKALENSGESGIINEKSKKQITVITDSSIEKVPKVIISGYTNEQCAEIQRQHKELLRYARINNDSKEVAFVFKQGITERTEFLGSDDRIDFGYLPGQDLFIMHNHPRNSSYSTTDIVFFIEEPKIKTFTIVKNNGDVEYLTREANYNANLFKAEYNRLYKKIVKLGTDEEKSRFVKTLLTKTKSGVIWHG